MKNKLVIRLIFLILSVAIMLFIFNMSNANATESSKISGDFIRKLAAMFYKDFDAFSPQDKVYFVSSLQNFIRKFAHFAVYFALGFCINGFASTFSLPFLKKAAFSSLFCLLYAVSDEIHQLFIPGRSGQVSDVLLDFIGAVLGILLMFAVFSLFVKIRSKVNEARARQQEA